MKGTAKQTALRLLARREHSRAELYLKLKQREFEVDDITVLLDDLAEKQYQSDERFANSYARMRLEKGYGPIRIRQELVEKEVHADLIDQALKGIDWFEAAHLVRQKRFGLASPEGYQEKAKQMRFLQYRGFSSDQIKQAVVAECSI